MKHNKIISGRYYDQLDGNTPFARAVNKMVSDYWVSTGCAMPIESACWEVMGDLYDRVHGGETLKD